MGRIGRASIETYHSIDLLERSVAAYRAGESRRAVGDTLCIAPSTVVKWAGLKEHGGSTELGTCCSQRPVALEGERERIVAWLNHVFHLTLRRLADELAARGLMFRHDPLGPFLRAEGLS